MKKKNGFTLIELLIVVGIIMGITLLEFQKMKAGSDDMAAQQAGKEMGIAIEALNNYVVKYSSAFQDMNDSVKYANIFPSNCTAIAGDSDTCELNLSVLVREGLVPSGWTPVNNTIKTSYKAYVRRTPAGCASVSASNCNIEAMIRTVDPWSNGGNIVYNMLGSAVRQAGPSSGYVQTDASTGLDQANGLFGGWSMPVNSYPGMVDGQLMGVVKIQASTINQFINVDGSLAMLNDLNMGNYRVNNAKDVQLLGQSSLPRQAGSVKPMLSSLMPNYVLKGVYSVGDYDSDPVNGSVPIPVCPDATDSSNGIPRILVKMSSMYNEMYGGMSGGSAVTTSDSQLQMVQKTTPAFGGWNFYALEDSTAGRWRIYVRRFYDNGYIPGEALAEVYCLYQ